jgi:hypothetical protein
LRRYLILKKVHDDFTFDSVLLQAIDETLLIYGENTRSAFYEYFKKALNIPRHRIPGKIEEFSRGLDDLLGVGAKSLEISVMMKLHSRIGVVWEQNMPNQTILPDLTFTEYIRHAKKYFEEANNYEDQFSIIIEEKKARLMYR